MSTDLQSDRSIRPSRILIAGCGDVGTAAGLLLAARGDEVFGLRRDPSGLPAGITPCQADLRSGEGLDRLPREVDVLLFTASAGRGADERDYRDLYVAGLRRVLEGLQRAGGRLSRLVFTASTAVYGQTDGSDVDEGSPTEPPDHRGATMLAAESLLRDSASERRGSRAVSLRLGGIYGPGRTYLLDAVRSGRLGVSADGRSPWTNRIHRDDAARAVVHLAQLVDPEPCYVGVDREPARRDDVVRWLARQMGIAPTVGGSGMRSGDRRCVSDRLVESGFSFTYATYRDGYRPLLAGTA